MIKSEGPRRAFCANMCSIKIKTIEKPLYLFVKQDGMYNTLEILVTDQDNKGDLQKDWYRIRSERSYSTLKEFLFAVYKMLMTGPGDTKQLTLWIDEDSIIITEKDIMVLNAEHFI